MAKDVQEEITPEPHGMYYTPKHIADLASGSGGFLKQAAERRARKPVVRSPIPWIVGAAIAGCLIAMLILWMVR